MVLSVQLYSLRDDIARDGLDAVLKQVKAAGFDGVELAGTYDLSPADLRRKLDAAGLVATGAHVSSGALVKDTAACVNEAAALGYRDLIIPWAEGFDNPQLYADFKTIAAAIPVGYRLGYHNHAHEFEGGDFLKKLYDEIPAIYFEPDTFWLKVAGKNVVEYCESLSPRVMALHLKELSAKGADDYNPVPGAGVTGCREVAELAEKLGHTYIVLEAEKLAIPYDEYLKLTAEFVNKVLG